MKKLLCVVAIAALTFFGCGGSSPPAPVAYSDVPTVSVVATPSTINQGESATLTWTSTNATGVEISGVPGATSPSGVVTVAPDQTTTYTVTARGANLSAPATVTVTVITMIVPPPPPPPPPPIFPVQVTVQWTMPTLYTDNTAIDPADIATLSVLLYMKSTSGPFTDADLPIAESMPGATSVEFGPVDVNRGATYYFSCKAKMATGEVSAFSPTVVHIWN
jgi:hypothetical protein